MTSQEPRFISIHTLSNRFEADLLIGALEHEQIPAFLRSFEETPYDGLFVSQRGWGLIMVREDLADQARRVIQPLIDELRTKKLYDDPSQIDPMLWERLREVEPQAICRNGQVRYDAQKEAYIVPFLTSQLACSPGSETIEDLDSIPHLKLNFELHLVTLHYLLEAQSLPMAGKWAGEKDIPGGHLFFQGPHKFPLDPLVELFGTRPDLFRSASLELGGSPVNMGDLSFRFWALPRIPIIFVLWKGDDEFPSAMNIRFDEYIIRQLHTLDTILAMVNVVCRTLRVAGKSILANMA